MPNEQIKGVIICFWRHEKKKLTSKSPEPDLEAAPVRTGAVIRRSQNNRHTL